MCLNCACCMSAVRDCLTWMRHCARIAMVFQSTVYTPGLAYTFPQTTRPTCLREQDKRQFPHSLADIDGYSIHIAMDTG